MDSLILDKDKIYHIFKKLDCEKHKYSLNIEYNKFIVDVMYTCIYSKRTPQHVIFRFCPDAKTTPIYAILRVNLYFETASDISKFKLRYL